MHSRRLTIYLVSLIMILIIVFICIAEFSVHYILGKKKSSDYGTEMVSIQSVDELTLCAKLTRQENLVNNNHRWALLIHSYGSDHSFMNSYAKVYQENGYNTLSPDNRAHGVSDGKYIGMGYLDQDDILCWINYILNIDPEAEIVLHGVSMGGAAVMMTSAREELPSNVIAVIEDCGYKSARSYLEWKLKHRFHIPTFPLIQIANIAFKVHAGYWMYDASAVDAVQSSKVPILFIHGTEDQTVPVDDVYKLYEAATAEKELYVVEGAGHGQAMEVNPEVYWEKVFAYIKKQGLE